MSNLIEIMFSVAGAEAVTGSMESIVDKSGELGGELMRLAGVAGTLGTALEGMKNALEVGSALTVLSARTGESIQSLVVMQRAFETAGVGADMMGIMVNRLQKAISGVNEMGKNTKGAFAALGLSPEELQGLGFDEQLKKLAAGFQQINDPAQRAAIAMDLFGREGGQMLALLTKRGLLTDAADDVGRYAERMQNLAPRFKEVEDKLSLMKDRLKEMWAVALEQLLPVLSKVGDLIKGLNLAPVGAALGSGGAIALAGGLTSGLASKLNTIVMAWATNPSTSAAGTAFASRFILPLTGGMMSLFSVLLPPVIIGAIIGAVVYGVMTGIADGMRKHNNEVSDATIAGFKPQESATQKLRGAANLDEEAAAKQSIQEKELADAKDQVAKLQAIQVAADKHNKPLKDAGYDSAATWGLTEEQQAQLEQAQKSITNIQRLLAQPVSAESLGAAAAKKAADALAVENAEYKGMGANLQKDTEAAHQAAMADEQDHAKKLKMLQDELAAKMSANALSNDATLKGKGFDDADIADRHVKLQAEISAKGKEIAETEKQITEEARRTTEEKKKQEEHAAKIYELGLQIKINEAHASGKTDQESALKAQLAGVQAGRAAIGAGADPGQAMELGYEAANAAKAEAEAKKQSLAIDAAKNALEDKQAEIQSRIAGLDADYARTDAEKWDERKKALTDAVAAAQAYLDKMKDVRAAAQTDEGKKIGDTNVRGAQKDLGSAQHALAGEGPDPNDFGANWTSTLTELRTQWELTAKTMASSMGGVLSSMQSGLSSAIEGMANRTKTLGQAFWTVAGSISQSFIKAASDMVAKWTMQHVVMAGISRLFNAQEVAGHAMTETTKVAVTTTAAGIRTTVRTTETVESVGLTAVGVGAHVAGEAAKTDSSEQGFIIRIALKIKEALAEVIHGAVSAFNALASIPYVGPILGAVAMAAALVGGMRLVSQIGHAEGGHIAGAGGPTDDQVPAMLSNGEWVAPAWQVNHPVYGPMIASLEAARRGTATFALGGLTSPQYFSPSVTRPAYAPAAAAAGGPAGGGNTVSAGKTPAVYILMDEKEFARKMQEHSGDWFQRQHASAMRKA